MSQQIAVRIPREKVRALDALVEGGAFESRAAAVRHGLALLLGAAREEAVAAEYQRAYAGEPGDTDVGEAAVELLSEALGAPAPGARG